MWSLRSLQCECEVLWHNTHRLQTKPGESEDRSFLSPDDDRIVDGHPVNILIDLHCTYPQSLIWLGYADDLHPIDADGKRGDRSDLHRHQPGILEACLNEHRQGFQEHWFVRCP